jgi:hypothetical protein
MARKDKSIGAFFACYNEKSAVLYSVEKLYSIYPEIPCYLVSDGGEDFSFLEDRFDRIKCCVDDNTRGKVTKLRSFQDDEERTIYAENSIYSFLDRIRRSVEYCKTDFIIIMEPDVLVKGELNLPDDCVVLGSLVNPFEEPGIHNLINEYGGKSFNRYGATPAIFRCDKFIEVHDFVLKNRDFIRKACEILPEISYSDILIPLIFSLKGYSETFNPDIIECYRNPEWEKSDKPLVHQFRNYY